MEKEQNETYPIYVRNINQYTKPRRNTIQNSRLYYNTYGESSATSTIFSHQPRDAFCRAQTKKSRFKECNTKSNIEMVGIGRELGFHSFTKRIQGIR